MALELISPPSVEPLSLAELKEFMRIDVDDTSQDVTLTGLMVSARSWCETFTRRRFIQQTWRLSLDFFPGYIDMKISGTKVSSPFVSGSNAVLVGIRYALVLPYPPVQSIVSFIYQNANGQVTSMITGPFTIASVSNVISQPVSITTTAPHGWQSGVSVDIAGNAQLLALTGQPSEVITVTGDSSFTLNGVLGTGTSIASGGNVTGYNYVQDLRSNPARVSPIFGQMWPVARVVLNAVEIDFVSGFANPIAATMAASSKSITGTTFSPGQVGQPISIAGAGPSGSQLNTIIASVDGSGNGATRDPAVTAVSSSPALVCLPNTPAGLLEAVKTAIKFHVNSRYENRLGSDIPASVKDTLWPYRDMRT